MKTLFIGKIWPEPASSAAGRRALDLLRALAAPGWPVTFACAAQKSERSADLQAELGIDTAAIALNDSSFDAWVQQLAPDLVLFDRFMTEEQFGWRVENACPDALRVVDTSDLHFLREARGQSLRTGHPPDLRNDIALREIASLLRSDLALVVSEYERDLLLAEFAFPPHLLAYWPLLADGLLPNPPSFENRQHCLMIGSFLHEPNWDAARWCREQIWPLVRAQLPGAECHLYGSYPPPKPQSLHAPQLRFHLRGQADDALATMARYRLNLAPLRFGAGLKGTLFDGFRAATPSIVTRAS